MTLFESCLPDDHADALLVGRIWDPAVAGPVPVLIRDGRAIDISALAPTVSKLLEREDLATCLPAIEAQSFPLDTLLATDGSAGAEDVHLLAPCDLQAIKASGVTFVASMLERVIEEQARGDAGRALRLRNAIAGVLGDNIAGVRPGSSAAGEVKALLLEKGLWSQYLEVGIGPDAEIFTKAQPLSAIGHGGDVGIHPRSEWNNPEPEVVLAVDSRGIVKGATLGNDVNLRDFEGRSALLLGKAKDNNASCAIGPFIRLFDARFDMDDVRSSIVHLTIEGLDGFRLVDTSEMGLISRDPVDLVGHAAGPFHQYPDGFMLFLGTMFAPKQDRDALGMGFTHHIGDRVRIASSRLGALCNRVDHSDRIAPWTFGIGALFDNLARRGLIGASL